jgi:hypothetical protein
MFNNVWSKAYMFVPTLRRCHYAERAANPDAPRNTVFDLTQQIASLQDTDHTAYYAAIHASTDFDYLDVFQFMDQTDHTPFKMSKNKRQRGNTDSADDTQRRLTSYFAFFNNNPNFPITAEQFTMYCYRAYIRDYVPTDPMSRPAADLLFYDIRDSTGTTLYHTKDFLYQAHYFTFLTHTEYSMEDAFRHFNHPAIPKL